MRQTVAKGLRRKAGEVSKGSKLTYLNGTYSWVGHRRVYQDLKKAYRRVR